jgi:hypothetical protein
MSGFYAFPNKYQASSSGLGDLDAIGDDIEDLKKTGANLGFGMDN